MIGNICRVPEGCRVLARADVRRVLVEAAAPPVAELMNGPETAAIDNMVKRIQRGIEVQSRKDFHIEKFEIRSKNKGRGND